MKTFGQIMFDVIIHKLVLAYNALWAPQVDPAPVPEQSLPIDPSLDFELLPHPPAERVVVKCK